VQLSVDLTVTPEDSGAFTCRGSIVAQDSTSTTNPAAATAEWLGNIDVAQLEAAALEAQSHSDGSYTAVVLELLRRWAGGR
jgi:hypothetical protein